MIKLICGYSFDNDKNNCGMNHKNVSKVGFGEIHVCRSIPILFGFNSEMCSYQRHELYLSFSHSHVKKKKKCGSLFINHQGRR